MEAIASLGVPCSACLDTAELHHNDHLRERGFVEDMEIPIHGKVPTLGFAPRMSQSHVEITPPPRLGADTDEVLRTELSISESQLSALRTCGAIGDSQRFQ